MNIERARPAANAITPHHHTASDSRPVMTNREEQRNVREVVSTELEVVQPPPPDLVYLPHNRITRYDACKPGDID